MPDYWNRQIERWMDIFSDDEPDLMGLELVKEFDNLTKYFYTSFEEDMNEWTESSEAYVGIRSEVVAEETIIEIPDPTVRPTKFKTIRAESIPSTADETLASKTRVKKDSSEDIIVSYENKEGKRRSRTLDVPDDIDFETAKATYKNGILEVKFDRQ